jgi:hypothetical protein
MARTGRWEISISTKGLIQMKLDQIQLGSNHK